MKRATLIKIRRNEIYSRVRVGKHLSDTFPFKKGLKDDALSPLLFNFALVLGQANQEALKVNCTHQRLVHEDDISTLGGSTHGIKKNTGA
jgi:hypothetical protein